MWLEQEISTGMLLPPEDNGKEEHTLFARDKNICSAFSFWYLAILASIASTSIPSIRLKASKGKSNPAKFSQIGVIHE